MVVSRFYGHYSLFLRVSRHVVARVSRDKSVTAGTHRGIYEVLAVAAAYSDFANNRVSLSVQSHRRASELIPNQAGKLTRCHRRDIGNSRERGGFLVAERTCRGKSEPIHEFIVHTALARVKSRMERHHGNAGRKSADYSSYG